MVWGCVSIVAFVFSVLSIGFAFWSLFSLFRKKAALPKIMVGIILAAVFFAVFDYAAVQVQKSIDTAGGKLPHL
jgi:uncharacterized BrkB/YihY/UPF0761 family membrane protein